MDKIRIDKWLWAARFYKTRSLAADALVKGRVLENGQPAKPAPEIAVVDLVSVRKEDPAIQVPVCGLRRARGPSTVARQLYEDTPASTETRQRTPNKTP